METKKNLWGCGGYPSPSKCKCNSKKKKKRSISKNKDSETICSSNNDHVNLATSLIKYVKKRCSSFTHVVNKRKTQQKPHSQENKHNQRRKKPSKHAAANVVTLGDWMLESPADVSAGSSGEFIVFMQSASKKIHPASQINPNPDDDDDFGSVSIQNSYYSMDHMEKLNSSGRDGGDGGEGEGGPLSPPPRRSCEDVKGKKRVSFMLPLVTKVHILDSADHLKEE